MTVQQAANTLLNQYTPDRILKALESMKKDAAPTASHVSGDDTSILSNIRGVDHI